jgi:hypothetical protein
MITFSQLGRQGRLGNQLWQIAATIATAKKYNLPYAFPKWEYEPFFNLHNCFTDTIRISKTYQEPHFHFAPIPHGSDLDLSGYFQSYKYFADYDQIIKDIFEFRNPAPPQKNTTSIHVRRGDYVNLSEYHSDLSITNYYEKTIAILDTEKYLIFSDDIEFCKKKFIGNRFSFVEGGNPASDLALMSACKNQIIANSSFSWWAAYLNKNPNKNVMAPKVWFGPKLPHNTKDLLPENWTKINA